jgi:hypothetical protein
MATKEYINLWVIPEISCMVESDVLIYVDTIIAQNLFMEHYTSLYLRKLIGNR